MVKYTSELPIEDLKGLEPGQLKTAFVDTDEIPLKDLDQEDILKLTKLQLLRMLASFQVYDYSMENNKAELLDAVAAASRAE